MSTLPAFQHTIQILTPAFVAGANPRADRTMTAREAVRPAGIIAGMRWWFRALAGGWLGSFSLERIWLVESLVFGTQRPIRVRANRGVLFSADGLSSRLRLRVAERQLQAERFETRGQADLAYLAFGMQRLRSEPARCYLKPGGKLTVSALLSGPRIPGEPEIDPAFVEALFRLWVTYGGAGSRWRHGLGGLELADSQVPTRADLPEVVTRELGEAREQMGRFLKATRNLWEAVAEGQALSSPPLFPVARKGFLQVKLKQATDQSAEAALVAIKRLWRGSRQVGGGADPRAPSKNRDLFAYYLYGDLPEDGSSPEKRIAFGGLGLPLPFQFLGDQENKGLVRPTGELGRRASPIWFRLRRVQEGIATLCLYWKCQYLPQGVSLQMEGGSETWPVAFDPNEAQIWFQTRLTSPQWLEIRWAAAANPTP